MNAEKQDVETKLAAMRTQAEQVIAVMEPRLGTGRFGPEEIAAIVMFVNATANLGHAVDRLLTALKWEKGS